jgi:hypothetical protein
MDVTESQPYDATQVLSILVWPARCSWNVVPCHIHHDVELPSHIVVDI